MNQKKEVRLQKYIADCGVTSRRKAEELILQGRVQLNGLRVTTMGIKINPSEDVVIVDNNPIDHASVQKVYIIMNKPKGYITTLNDPEGRPTVMDLCQEVSERIYPVGRLDYQSEGLLILTNDGEFANKIIHPSNNVTKVYEVKVFGLVNQALLKKLKSKVEIEGTWIKPQSVRVLSHLKNKTWLEFRLEEGKNREIRNICAHNGITIDKLKRVAIGGLGLKDIGYGKYIFANRKDLVKAIGFNDENIYFSHKKSVTIKEKKFNPKSKLADDKVFYKFRKEFYQASLKSYNNIKKSK